MKRKFLIAVFFVVACLFMASCTDSLAGSGTPIAGKQIIADHTIVDDYDKIPARYMAIVKTYLVDMVGESHSGAYRYGMALLQAFDPDYAAEIFQYNVPEAGTAGVRVGRHAEVGEGTFYTNTAAIAAMKQVIADQAATGNPFTILGFGWCWDMTWMNDPAGEIDPVYNVRWAGSSVDGPEGNSIWGLDAADEALTGNSVCMDTYLNAVVEYNEFCDTNNYPTKVIFTTGPVDGNNGSENGFQREIKHDYIRSFVAANSDAVLFDYADILCWNNAGEQNITIWNDGGTERSHANIHNDNQMDYDAEWNLIAQETDTGGDDHIGEVGALRLAKAMWWMLARLAGWDGVSTD